MPVSQYFARHLLLNYLSWTSIIFGYRVYQLILAFLGMGLDQAGGLQYFDK